MAATVGCPRDRDRQSCFFARWARPLCASRPSRTAAGMGDARQQRRSRANSALLREFFARCAKRALFALVPRSLVGLRPRIRRTSPLRLPCGAARMQRDHRLSRRGQLDCRVSKRTFDYCIDCLISQGARGQKDSSVTVVGRGGGSGSAWQRLTVVQTHVRIIGRRRRIACAHRGIPLVPPIFSVHPAWLAEELEKPTEPSQK